MYITVTGVLSFAAKQIERIQVVDPNGVPQTMQIDVSSDGEYSFLAQHIFRHGQDINRFALWCCYLLISGGLLWILEHMMGFSAVTRTISSRLIAESVNVSHVCPRTVGMAW